MSIRNEKPLAILEHKVTLFLQGYACDDYSKNEIAPYVAKISLQMNHLYQDLGFKSRVEMGRFMKKHFPKLTEIKPADKLWKKYIYDSIGEVAPACEHCSDQVNCFVCKM